MTATGASAIQESAFQPSAIGFWFQPLIPERLAPELTEPVAITRHPKLHPSQSSGLRFPFEFALPASGRAKHPCLAATDQGWSALPDRSPPPETIKALLTPQTLTLGVQVIGS